MIKTINLFAIILLSTCLLLSSCFFKTTKKISAALIKKDTTLVKAINENTNVDSLLSVKVHIKKLTENKIKYKTLKLKAKVEIANTQKGWPVLNAFINIAHNEKIWVRLAVPGVDLEVVKALITKDSIIVIDHNDKNVYKRTFAYLQEITNLPFDFETIENFLAGNPISVPDSIIGFKYNANLIDVIGISKNFKERLSIDTTNHIMLSNKLDDLNLLKSRTCQITYSQYENTEARLISMIRDIIISDKTTSQIKLNLKDIVFNREDLTFSIKIPKKYKVK